MPNGNSNFIGKDAAILKWRYNTNFPSTHKGFKIINTIKVYQRRYEDY
ncbi:MAG: hypothetical protein IPN79_18600 [Saprospiraceae bacterium]|nr:hypothetical protein [Saprospiraceae bacterium]